MGTVEPKIDVLATCWHHRSGRKTIHQEMIDLEIEFKCCDRHKEPGRWFRLQGELGEVYRRVMKYYR